MYTIEDFKNVTHVTHGRRLVKIPELCKAGIALGKLPMSLLKDCKPYHRGECVYFEQFTPGNITTGLEKEK